MEDATLLARSGGQQVGSILRTHQQDQGIACLAQQAFAVFQVGPGVFHQATCLLKVQGGSRAVGQLLPDQIQRSLACQESLVGQQALTLGSSRLR